MHNVNGAQLNALGPLVGGPATTRETDSLFPACRCRDLPLPGLRPVDPYRTIVKTRSVVAGINSIVADLAQRGVTTRVGGIAIALALKGRLGQPHRIRTQLVATLHSERCEMHPPKHNEPDGHGRKGHQDLHQGKTALSVSTCRVSQLGSSPRWIS